MNKQITNKINRLYDQHSVVTSDTYLAGMVPDSTLLSLVVITTLQETVSYGYTTENGDTEEMISNEKKV